MRAPKIISLATTTLFASIFLTSAISASPAPCFYQNTNTPCYIKNEDIACCPDQVAECNKRPAFFKILSGSAFSQKARISADPSVWDSSLQGYNSKLGTAAILGAAVGYEFYNWLSGDVTLLHQWDFKYNKFQTPVSNITIPGALGPKTRHFKLASTSVMFDARLLGKGLGLAYNFNCNRDYISPFLGGGLGLTYHRLSNFYSTIAPTSITRPSPGAVSIGVGTTTKTSLSYQFEVGAEYRHNNKWGLAVGYRWFDAGKFRGPNHIIAGNGVTGNPIVGAVVPAWKGRLQAHQVFAEFSYHF